MTQSKTLDLLKKVRLGDEQAKEEVVKDNLGLVWSIVHRFKNSYYDKEDLFQIGCIGLMKAINHFDTSYQVQFSTYAVPIIMGEIKRYFRDDGTIKVSRSLKELNIKVTKAKEYLQSQNNQEPTIEDVAKYLGVEPQDVVEAIDASYYPTSLNEPIYEKDGSTISVEDRLIDKSDEMWFEKIALEMEMEKLDDKGVIMKFPAALSSTSTRLVLKEPKTKTSIRKVFLPKTVAEMLIARKKEIEELKELFGSEFTDYQLVFCSTNGRPMEGQVINRALNKLIREHDLPKIVFHSLRHSSITYKLKLNGGDMKSVQGDSGHAQAKMVADVYSHIIDDDRRMNAQRFEETFYSPKKEDMGKEQEKTADSVQESDQELLMKLLAKPEMAALLKTLAKGL